MPCCPVFCHFIVFVLVLFFERNKWRWRWRHHVYSKRSFVDCSMRLCVPVTCRSRSSRRTSRLYLKRPVSIKLTWRATDPSVICRLFQRCWNASFLGGYTWASQGQRSVSQCAVRLPEMSFYGDRDGEGAIRHPDGTRPRRRSSTDLIGPVCCVRHGRSLHPTPPSPWIVRHQRRGAHLDQFVPVKPKNRPGPAGARKNCPRYHCSWHWSIFSLQYRYNDHIW